MLRTVGDACKVLQLQGQSLSPFGTFYLATLGAARALYLDDKVGDFAEGKEADFVVLDASRTAIMERRWNVTEGIAARLFLLLVIGDDPVAEETYLMAHSIG
jgi:guanine deaminase